MTQNIQPRGSQVQGKTEKAKTSISLFDLAGTLSPCDILEMLPHGVCLLDVEGRITAANAAFDTLFAAPPGDLIGSHIYDMADGVQQAADLRSSLKRYAVLMPQLEPCVRRFISCSGDPLSLEEHLVYRSDGKGGVAGFIATYQDMSERLRYENVLRRSEARQRRLLDSLPLGIRRTDAEGTVTFTNQAHDCLFAVDRYAYLGKKLDHYLGDEKDRELIRRYMESAANGSPLPMTLVTKEPAGDGRILDVQLELNIERDDEDRVQGFVALVSDVSERMRMEKALRRSEKKFKELSIKDELTGLFNSRYFHKRIRVEIQRTLRYDHPLSVIFMDIDNFKSFNDTYGHLEGDKVLSVLGGIIAEAVRGSDSGFRYGGEEFAVILPETEAKTASVVAERIRTALKATPFSPPGAGNVHRTVSMGVAQFSPHQSAEDLIALADACMYQAKRSGKDCIHIYDDNEE